MAALPAVSMWQGSTVSPREVCVSASNVFVISTHYPPGLFALRSTSATVVVPDATGARIHGDLDVALFGVTVRIRIEPRDALVTGRESGGNRPLLQCRTISLKDPIEKKGPGPGFVISSWSFSKAEGVGTELAFKRYAVWSRAENLGSTVPSNDSFALLLPGVAASRSVRKKPSAASPGTSARDTDGGQAWTGWLQSLDNEGRLVHDGDSWFLEREVRLYPRGQNGWQAGLTFTFARAGEFLPLTLYVNYKKKGFTRVRVRIDETDGTPSSLGFDAPSAPAGTHLLCLQLPPEYPISISMSQAVDGKLPLESVVIDAGTVRANVHDSLRADIDFGGCARWSAPGTRLQIVAALPLAKHDTSSCSSVVFCSRRGAPESPLDDERFDGIRIEGVDSVARACEVLDARDVRAEILLKAGHATGRPLVALSNGWLGPRASQRSQDNQPGILDMPVARALLRIERGKGPAPLVYALTAQARASKKPLWQGRLDIGPAARLLAPPFGGAASTAGAALSDWSRAVRMRLPSDKSLSATQSSDAASCDLQLAPDWQAQWRLDGVQDLALHDLANLPATFREVRFQGAAAAAAAQAGRKTMRTSPMAATKDENLAYTVLTLALLYIAGAYEGQGWDKFFETELVLKLDEEAFAKWAERNALDDVVVVLDALGKPGPQRTWLQKFVTDNLKKPTDVQPERGAIWPFASGMGIPLYEVAENGKVTWLWDMKRGDKFLHCGFAFDYSRKGAIGSAPKLGLPASFFETAPKEQPALWPRSRKQADGMMPGTVEDPASAMWSGIFIADVPLALAVDIPKGTEFLRKLRDIVNERLRLAYGWLDANGHTWLAKWEGAPTRLYPFDLEPDPVVQIDLRRVESAGAQGQAVSSVLEIDLTLRALDTADRKPQALRFIGEFGMLAGQTSMMELKPASDQPIGTATMPGFQSIRFKRFRTDFHSASVEVTLTPSAELKHAIPFFEQTDLMATLTVPLDGTGSASMGLRLPAEAATRLFGKWPIGIRGIEFSLGKDRFTKVGFMLDLGIPGIPRTGGTLTLTTVGGKLHCDVELEALSIDLSRYGVELQGTVEWRAPKHEVGSTGGKGAVELSQATQRDFYGAVRLGGLAKSQQAALYLRIGSQGRPFWVAALVVGGDPSVVGKKVDDTLFLLAYGAKSTAGDVLRQQLASAQPTLPEAMFPTRGVDPVEWLNGWDRAADGLGLAVGLSGNFSLDGFLASAPDNKRNLSILWSDSGLFYAASRLKIFGVHPTDFHLLVDFANQYMSAGMQLGGLDIGGGLQVSAGYLSAGLGWGRKKGFGFTLGYPPMVPSPDPGMDILDWSKAVSVRVPACWPVNTFQGGLKAWYYSEPDVDYGFAVAVRVGYSNSWKVTGSDIADARADVGVMVGGSFQFCRTDLRQPVPAFAMLEQQDRAPDEAWLADAIRRMVEVRQGSDMLISASIFGDVWGHASVVFLGVTIAGVKIDARAVFSTTGSLNRGILYMGADFAFGVSVKIGCSSYSTRCSFRIVMIDRGGGASANCNHFMRDLREHLLAIESEVV